MIDKNLIPALLMIVLGILAILSHEGKKWATALIVGAAVLVVGFLLLGAWGALQLGLTP